ncbi:right-handed parallel beta-helix repeat-containing protein [Streptomyces sp. H10-C2]|uniref:right-handed parallel beta-helix repeat-containing protein n=1 Tax=unclassified Streptomyces TaxID=2593676 RepID=UPI0024BA4F12|nr:MULTISPECIES: right-handed parallel beta-helix repeat-containing protein [unclassified Streptomyces]MDJ0346008.1 right-handed parallel beta-helix repeat-containing protein [Streptomyces sp. PH10-H1]MDJ0370485.1 right-handed parallel beta-helix repeat-containing protein [Streptomyces sp. H10-C2]
MTRIKPVRTLAGACFAAVLLFAMVVPASAGTSGTTRYVDCTAGSDTAAGTGTTTAWRSLDKVNATVLHPGDTIRFKAGTTCTGTLTPQGSGTAQHPVTVNTYGSGSAARIDGHGATAAVFLHNVEGYVLRHLDITNTGPAPTATQQRVGVYVLLEEYGTGSHYTLSHLTVHDVNGCDCRDDHSSGGILFVAGGVTVPTGFDDLRVEENSVSHVDRTGIGTVSYWQRRASHPQGPGTEFAPMTHVLIEGNRVSDTGGDGISLINGVDSLIQHNTVAGFNIRSTDYNVGAYAWNSDRALFQFNEVSGGVSPAMAFDLEGGSRDTLYQYNFSHDNGAGFLFICPSGVLASGGIVRYNISQNDHGDGFFGVITNPCGDEPGTQVYNNTIYAPTAANLVRIYGTSTMRLTNNIFVGRPSGSVINDPTSTYDHNLYQNVVAGTPLGTNALQGDPRLTAPGTAVSPTDTAGYRLRAGSPALHSGVPVAGAGGRDYFGNPIPSTAPNIGAYQGCSVGS